MLETLLQEVNELLRHKNSQIKDLEWRNDYKDGKIKDLEQLVIGFKKENEELKAEIESLKRPICNCANADEKQPLEF